MVNTRRMESNDTARCSRQRTRGSVRLLKPEDAEESRSSSVNESDSEDSVDKDSSSNSKEKIKQPIPKRRISSRTLPQKFTFRERNYKPRALRSAHKRISLEERTLSVYSSRKMHHDSDPYEQGHESEEDLYTVRGRRTRHLIRMNRMQRRTALSLRPISQKCYADPRSPINFNSDSDGGRVRRSKRKKQSSMSWLADSQMHKVGYPNLNVGYSEEDSRDAADAHNEMEITRRVTRRRNDLGLRREANGKYIFEYDNSVRTRIQKEIRPRRESNDKENKKENSTSIRTNGRLRSMKTENHVEPNDADEDHDEKKVKAVETKKDTVKEEPKVNGDVHDDKKKTDIKEQPQSSDSDDEPDRVPLSRLRPNRNRSIMCDTSFGSTSRTSTYPTRSNRSYPPSRPPGRETNFQSISAPGFRERNNRNQKVIESSSSEEEEEEGRKYSLRDRRPKPAPKTMQTSVLKTRDMRPRIRYKRRSQGSSSSSSDSSSDRRCRPPPKSPHSKNEKMKSGGGMKIVPIKPEILDTSVRFNSIGGLDSHIQCLKEMILLPMMYPEVFRQFQIKPPRGVLFHGPPGTGKTLIARALANECSFGSRKVSFFLRKGADLLSKWIGESEKQLRMLFQQAAEMKPSIIFFDELDGLAPVRSSRQDQIHASIVSTLLALMDGLDDRGEVIVIGATNRIDSIDPALRRPGRFDRELYFPLPSCAERLEILKVHVASWSVPPTEQLLNYLAENTLGYCGSDLRALCSEAVIQSFRRTYPQVYTSEHRLLLNPENVKVDKIDFIRAKSLLVPASHRVTNGLGRKLFPILDPLLQEPLKKSLTTLEPTFPHGFNAALAKVKLSSNVRPAQLLLTGNGPDHGQTSHLAPAILFKMEHIHAYLLDVTVLYQETGRSAEEACIQVFNEARKNIPSIIYIPNLDKWWELVTETVKAILLAQINQLTPNTPILLLATADTLYADLPEEIKEMFSQYRKEIVQLHPPTAEARRLFYKPLIINGSLQQPRSNRELPKTPSPLPRAPTPAPTPLTEEQKKKLYETEEHTLRELRIFLRDMCKKLANNKLFFMFTKPVDTEEVPDYTEIIKQPMDLETMMTKVDFHLYECARDFLNDIELICQNALEYNPAKSSADKQIRHRACSLRDYAYTLIKTEMDTDFEDKCQEISRKRRLRKHCPTQYLPPYINTPDGNISNLDDKKNENKDSVETGVTNEDAETLEKPSDKFEIIKTPLKKRKRASWQRGLLKKKKRRILNNHSQAEKAELSSGDDSKENDTETQTDKTAKISDSNKSKSPSTPEKAKKVDPTSSLTINCDTNSSLHLNDTKNLQSPKRRLSDILSPSELLDSPLDFDELDEALQETSSADQTDKQPIECSQSELEKVLEQAVKITEGYSLVYLLDLYNLLSRIVKKFSRTSIRTALPKELLKEISRFKKEGTIEFNNSLSHT